MVFRMNFAVRWFLVLSNFNFFSYIESKIPPTLSKCYISDHCYGKIRKYPNYLAPGFTARNCFCDKECSVYGDCCMDSPFQKINNTEKHVYKCLKSNLKGEIFVQVTCSGKWKDGYVKSNCINVTEGEKDPMKLLPVTDLDTKITYRNIYCALCNNAKSKNLISWNIIVSCDLEKIFEDNTEYTLNSTQINPLLKKVKFNGTSEMWEVKINDTDNHDHTVNCYNVISAKEILDKELRLCKPKYIDECAQNWTDKVIEEKCRSHTLYRYVNYKSSVATTYRNKFCARCNYVPETGLECKHDGKYILGQYPQPYAITMNVTYSYSNMANGNQIFTKCKEGFVYNRNSSSCTQIGCDKDMGDIKISCKPNMFY